MRSPSNLRRQIQNYVGTNTLKKTENAQGADLYFFALAIGQLYGYYDALNGLYTSLTTTTGLVGVAADQVTIINDGKTATPLEGTYVQDFLLMGG